jgi:putative FmdB family regulatory protein
MPTYEYVCEKCKHRFEVYQSMKDPPLSTCPEGHCAQKKWGKGQVKRLIGKGAGFIFKGSGFYSTDYRSENYKSGAKKETETKSTGSAKTGSDSSTAPKADTKADTKPAPAAADSAK